MKKEKITDFNKNIQKLYHSSETRKLQNILFHQTKIFENAFSQNVKMIFERAQQGKLGFMNNSQLLDILNSKFEIDQCSLYLQGFFIQLIILREFKV